jgi:hypothetical protein
MPGVVLGQRRWPGVWNLTLRASRTWIPYPPSDYRTDYACVQEYGVTKRAFRARLRSIPRESSGFGLDLRGLLDFAQGRSLAIGNTM